MKAIVSKVLKEPADTMGIVELHINEKGIDIILNASMNNSIKASDKPREVELCFYSEEYCIDEKLSDVKGSIKKIDKGKIEDTYCEVKGRIKRIDKFNDEIYVDVKCLDKIFQIVCYEKDDYSLKEGDYLKAICWTEIVEGKS